jgi:hypothetical protein
MAAKRKKEVQYEADSSQARVNEYFRKNPMTGNPFKDIGGLLATRDDRNRAIAARKSLDEAADRDVTMRGQDFTKELGFGEIDVRKDANEVARMGHQLSFAADMGRTAAYKRGQNQQFELGKGELNLNQDIFKQTSDRYKKYGEPADKLTMAERAATARVGAAESGFELSEDLFKETSKYLKDGKPVESDLVATPTPTAASAIMEPENVSRASIIGQYIKEGTGIPNPYNDLIPTIKQGRKIGKRISSYLFDPSVKRAAKKSQ